jgi:hypothetical protein
MSHTDRDGNDINIFIHTLKVGDFVYLQDFDDATRYQRWEVTGAITEGTVGDTIPVTLVESTYSFTDEMHIYAVFIRTGQVGPTGATGATGATGPQGLAGFAWDVNRVDPNGYLVGDIVNYLGNYYICIANNDALIPTTSLGVYWNEYSFVGAEGATGPTGPQGEVGPTGPAGAGDMALSDLTDADISSDPDQPSQVLAWNETTDLWERRKLSFGTEFDGLWVDNPQEGQVLTYVSDGEGGFLWFNTYPSGGGGNADQLKVFIKNNSGTTAIPVGTLVYAVSYNDGALKVEPVDVATSTPADPTKIVGIVVDNEVAADDYGYALISGKMSYDNSVFSGSNTALYAGNAGALTETAPAAPYNVAIAWTLDSSSTGEMFVDFKKSAYATGGASLSAINYAGVVNPPMVSGSYYPPTVGVASGTLTYASSRLFFTAVVVNETTTFDRIGLEVTTAGAAGTVTTVHLYSSSATSLLPDSLITSFGSVAIDSTGIKEITISQVLEPGIYWVGNITNAASSAFRAVTFNPLNLSILNSTATSTTTFTTPLISGFYVSTATAPSTINPANIVRLGTSSPIIKMRKA